jgi:hypothetical protein
MRRRRALSVPASFFSPNSLQSDKRRYLPHIQLRRQLLNDVEANVHVPISQLPGIVDALHAQAQVAIHEPSWGAAVTPDSYHEFLCARGTFSATPCTASSEGALHRSIHGLDGYRGIPCMRSAVSAPGAVRYDHGR